MSFPQKFGKYTLIDRLAAGGMAEVFRAHLGPPGSGSKIIAIKRMLPNISGDEDFVKLFEKEIGLASQLTHQNLVAVYDFGTIDGHYYLAMEYVHGKSLQNMRVQAGKAQPLPVDFCCYVTREVCRAFDYAHGFKDPVTKNYAGIVHRDISPHNILLSYGGNVKLFDFGVAKIANKESSTIGSIKGKPAYLSPEQALGKELDGRTDIFALGIVFWEILTGQRLFYADQPIIAIRKVLEEPIVAPSSINPLVPKEVDAVVLKALDRDMYTRFQLSQEFGAALDEVMKSVAPGFGLEQSRELVSRSFSEAIQKENVELTAKMNGEEVADPDATGSMPVPGEISQVIKEPSRKKLNSGATVSPNGTLIGMKPYTPTPEAAPAPPAGNGAMIGVAAAAIVAAIAGAAVFIKQGNAPAPAVPAQQAAAKAENPITVPEIAKSVPAAPVPELAHTPASVAAAAPAPPPAPAVAADKCAPKKICGLVNGGQVTYPNACALDEAKALLAYEGACEASRPSGIKLRELVLNDSPWKQTNAYDKSAFYGESLLVGLELNNMPSLEKGKLQAVLRGEGAETGKVEKVKQMITLSTTIGLGKDLPKGFYSVEVQMLGPDGKVLMARKAEQKFYLGNPDEVKTKVVDLGNKHYKKGSGTREAEGVMDEEENRRAAAEAGIPYEEYLKAAAQNRQAQQEREEFLHKQQEYELQQRNPAGK